jgi:aspartate beta-hydroxylase
MLALMHYASAFAPSPKNARHNLIELRATLEDFRSTTTIPSTRPAPLHTFAGKVENGIVGKFGAEKAQRVIDSWRLLDTEYEHREFFGQDGTDPQTSNCYQFAHSYVPGLTVKPFWDIDEIAWTKKLAKSYKQIRKEFLDVTKDMSKLQQDGNNVWAGALTEEAGGYGEGWSTLVLKDRGIWDEVNCNLFPKTAQAVYNCGIPATEVFFAAMKPSTDIKLHSDFTNFVLTSHLAIDIPENGNNKCRLTIGDETRQWINGEVMVFDTSLMHDAINEADSMRYILMFRIWHPDLTEVENNALQYIYDCLSVPELLDDNEQVRTAAESQIETLRNFPKLQSTTSGFGDAKVASVGKKKKKGKR